MSTEEADYLWRHFQFNADQRLKAFNFFVIFSVFANGGVFAAFERQAQPAILVLLGGFVCVLAIVFALIDARSQSLVRLAVPGLKEYEERFPEHSRLFVLDARRHSTFVRYTIAFRILFVLQLLFGLGVAIYAVTVMTR